MSVTKAVPTEEKHPAGPETLPLSSFAGVVTGTFLDRPNRFVLRCHIAGRVQHVYLPNPGRLWEILLPGTTISLVRSRGGKLPYIAVAAEKNGMPVLLHTHVTNDIVAACIERKLIPGLEDARIIKREYPRGHSRFDFLLEKSGRPFLLEAKSCTLFGRRIAMFPDAVTRRGQRHLTELAALSRAGTPGGVVFLVHASRPGFFLPDYHTDPDFARILVEAKNDIFIKAVAAEWRQDMTLDPAGIRDLTIPWDLLKREAKDRGAYILLMQLTRNKKIHVGGLGTVPFRRGFYLYAGSAGNAPVPMSMRHRKIKRPSREHADFLRAEADSCMTIPIVSGDALEHQLAEALLTIGEWFIPRFGSDCACKTHLVGMKENPLHCRRFIDLLSYFRIDRLEGKLP